MPTGILSPLMSEKNGGHGHCFSVAEDPNEDEEDHLNLSIRSEERFHTAENSDKASADANIMSFDDGEGEESHGAKKIKMPKGGVFVDKVTQKRRYMTPLEQFLNEQQELFKKNVVTSDDQGSITMTTAISSSMQQPASNSSM